MEIVEFLSKQHQSGPTPDWLRNWRGNDSFHVDDFLSEDVIFYPGGGKDGQPIRLFSEGCKTTCYVYADNHPSILERVKREFSRRPLKGYNLLNIKKLNYDDIFEENSFSWRKGFELNETDHVGDVYIFRKSESQKEVIGAGFIAVLYLRLDAFGVYQELFAKRRKPPLGILLADHGFGDNNGKFGSAGGLEDLADRFSAFPRWLIVAKNTEEWKGYQRAKEVKGDTGGMHSNRRYLFSKQS